jgi:triosephosphate isomerase
MSPRRPIVAANWKLNGSRASNRALLTAIRAGLSPAPAAEIVVCPPFVYLAETAEALSGSGIALGAQDVAIESAGAYTGEVSAGMLLDVGCRFVIVGHSERRSLYGESDEVVARKAAAAAGAGLQPIICIGESLADREAGRTLAVTGRQLRAVLDIAGPDACRKGVIAYEPVWAIGTGRTATPQQAQEVHAAIRALVAERDATMAASLRILYGGSVKGSNADDLFGMADIDGGLIGGASLNAADFLAICNAATASN